MSPTGPLSAGTVTDVGANPGVNAWTNPNNAKVLDGTTADFPYFQGVTVNNTSNPLKFTNFGFNIPSTAIIDSFIVNVTRSGIQVTESVHLLKAGSSVGSDLANIITNVPPTSLGTFPFSGTGLVAWTPSDVNNSGFGVQLDSTETHDPADSSYHVDAVTVSVYWHTTPVDVAKRYIYKIFNSSGKYLGNLPKVDSPFELTNSINTVGGQISIVCGVSADTSGLAPDPVTDEAGNILTDESGNPITEEVQLPIVAKGDDTRDALIKNGNKIQVWESGYWNPNGKCMFRGKIENWAAGFGSDDGEAITILCYSNGQDLNQYPVRGYPYTYTTDQSQTSQNTAFTVSNSGVGYSFIGQTFKVGAGITNLGAISLMLNGTGHVSIAVWDSPAKTTQYATGFASVALAAPTETQIAFYLQTNVTAGQTLFFEVQVEEGDSLSVYYQNTDVYSFGTLYTAVFGGGGGGGWSSTPGSDLYFKTFEGTGSTLATFTSLDPTATILPAILNDYISRGGLITLGRFNASGYQITIEFNTTTIFEALQTLLTVAPSNYYFSLDMGTDQLLFPQGNTEPDLTIIKGVHIAGLSLVATIEQVVNTVLLTGGLIAGSNIYVNSQDPSSASSYGVRLDRPSNPSIVDATVGSVVADGEVAQLKDEQYNTVVKILDRTMDTSTLLPGQIVGFQGFGTFIDSLLLQIVKIDYAPEAATLTLGVLPKTLNNSFDRITRQLIAASTVDNPTSPS